MLREDEEATVTSLDCIRESGQRVVVPKRGGVIAEDGTMRIAVIRPCVSRGARILGLPPIYTPQMLEANATVFRNWPMYADHLQEQLAEMESLLSEDVLHRIEEARRAQRKRGVFELGGRIIESWWDPTIKFEDDDEWGFQPGAVVGQVIAQENVARMVARDPLVMGVSIAAYPTGAKPGRAPWDPSREGALIEGIVRKPAGSVDWVVRAGAGGRVLTEDDDKRPAFALCLLEAAYDLAHADEDEHGEGDAMSTPDFTKMTPQQVREWFETTHPAAAAAVREDERSKTQAEFETTLADKGYVTESDLEEVLEEQRRLIGTDLREALAEHATEAKTEAQRLDEQRDRARELSTIAHELIGKAELLTEDWKTDIKRRYLVLPSGPTEVLVTALAESAAEGAEKTDEELIREAVERDVEHATKLIRSVKPDPEVTGQGGGEGGEGGVATKTLPKVEESHLLTFLTESETDPEKKTEDILGDIAKAVSY